MASAEAEKKATSADYYFDPRARFSVHELLIKDHPRQKTLTTFIKENAGKIRGKTVLVVESGLGLLAMQCARDGGAAKVVCVDESVIINKAREVVHDNGLSEICSFFQGKVGEVELPLEPNSVDLILCEWMGHLLTNDPVIKQLIRARDLYLKEDGLIVPDTASLHLTTCSDKDYKAESLGFWDNVYSFKMSCMKQLVLDCPVVSPIPAHQCVTDSAILHTINAYSVTEDEVNFTADYELTSSSSADYVHYLIAYISFGVKKHGWKGFNFYTSPSNPTTHWQQTCFALSEDLAINKGDVVKGQVFIRPEGIKSYVKINIEMEGSAHCTSYSQEFSFYHC